MCNLARCLLTAALILSASACGTTPVAVTPPKAEPYDLRCDADAANTCSGDCPELPAWTPSADGTGRAKLRACQACIQRGRDAGVIR